jgi:hypothetical protein
MKNVVFWRLKPQFVLHRRHITSPLQSSASSCYVRFEVFTAVTMKNTVFLDVKLCSCVMNRRFGGTYDLHHDNATCPAHLILLHPIIQIMLCEEQKWQNSSLSTVLQPLSPYFIPLYEKKNSVGLSPQANYTDWAPATCRRNLAQTFVDRGMSRGQRGGSRTVSRPESLLLFQVAPHLSSQGLSGPRSRPTATQKIW